MVDTGIKGDVIIIGDMGGMTQYYHEKCTVIIKIKISPWILEFD